MPSLPLFFTLRIPPRSESVVDCLCANGGIGGRDMHLAARQSVADLLHVLGTVLRTMLGAA